MTTIDNDPVVIQVQIDNLLKRYTVKQILEALAMQCVNKAHAARADGDRDMQREWQHTAMWINSITGKVTV